MALAVMGEWSTWQRVRLVFLGFEMSAANSTLSVKEWNSGFLHGAFFPTTTKSLAAGAAARGVSSTQARRAQMRGIALVPFFEGSECFEP